MILPNYIKLEHSSLNSYSPRIIGQGGSCDLIQENIRFKT